MRNRKLISRNVNPLGEKTTKLKLRVFKKTKKSFIKENKLKKIEFKVELFVFTTKIEKTFGK